MTIAEPTKRQITERFCIRNDDVKKENDDEHHVKANPKPVTL
jgi:hypothetical protein